MYSGFSRVRVSLWFLEASISISASSIRCLIPTDTFHEEVSHEFPEIQEILNSIHFRLIENLAELVCFDHGFMSCLVKLKELHIGWCDKLTYLWQDGNEMLSLTCLQSVFIEGCPQFSSFMAGEVEIELPYSLEGMKLSNCMSLEKLPNKMHALRNLEIDECPKLTGQTISPYDPDSNNPVSQLEFLKISNCDSLTSFQFAKHILAALKTLSISRCKGLDSPEEITIESLESSTIVECENLGSLPQCLHKLSHLAHLEITTCPALEIEDFPRLPITLSKLVLWNCSKIKSIASWNIASCNNLTCLEIRECPALEIEDFRSLPFTPSKLVLWSCPKIKSIANCNIASCNNLTDLEIRDCSTLEIEDFPPLPITLSYFYLTSCWKVKSLPNEWHRLTSPWFLEISDCKNIKSFRKGDLPPNLRWFSLWECENLKKPVREWGLHMLTSLETLGIDGISMGGEGEKVRFPSEENDEEDAWSLLFPSSLTDLVIIEMKNVERLSSGLRNHLSSLQELWIFDCPKLRYLPEDGLPPSLQRLVIYGCEILKDRCSNLGGDYWPLIQDIPSIVIDHHRIQ